MNQALLMRNIYGEHCEEEEEGETKLVRTQHNTFKTASAKAPPAMKESVKKLKHWP
jgi:hypothetical protein